MPARVSRGIQGPGEGAGSAGVTGGWLPISRQEVGKLTGCGRGQAREHVFEVLPEVEAATLATDHHGIDDGASPTGVRMADEEEVLLPDSGRPDRVLDQVMPTSELCRAEFRSSTSPAKTAGFDHNRRGIIWDGGDTQGLVTTERTPEGSSRFLWKSSERLLEWRSPARTRQVLSLQVMPRAQQPKLAVRVGKMRFQSATRHNAAVGITGLMPRAA